MRAPLVLAPIILAIFAGSFLAKAMLREPPPPEDLPSDAPCERIVSTAPSITETLFALGLGEKVVGVTRYCRYPAAAIQKPKIGGYFDPNFEAIIGLKPDLVIVPQSNQPTRSAFGKLGLRTLTVDPRNVEGILESIPTIGGACGVPHNAKQIVADMRARMQRLKVKTAGLTSRRVMIVLDRSYDRRRLADVQIVGNDGHLDRLIEMAGGQNVRCGSSARFPMVSTEGILQLDPQVIVDIVPESRAAEFGEDVLLADWRHVAEVEAVRDGRMHLLVDDRAVLPGPDFIRLAEDLARLIHPEVDWR